MKPITKTLYSVDQIRAIEHYSVEKAGIEAYTLMQRAAKASFQVLEKYWPEAVNISVICGSGNNGGDGLELAHLLHASHKNVQVFLINDPKKYQGPAKKAYLTCKDIGVTIHDKLNKKILQQSDVIVDALFGIGLTTPLREQAKNIIRKINEYKKPVFALDVPSGLHANNGLSLGAVIHSDVCVTFIGLKQGLLTNSAQNYYHHLELADLGLSELTQHIEPQGYLIHPGMFASFFQPRAAQTHKGDYGHVAVIGSAPEMSGAVRLAGLAALRSGAGLVTIATHPYHAKLTNIFHPEMMVQAVGQPNDMLSLLEKADVLAFGMGLGQSEWAYNLWKMVINFPKAKIIDADALNLLAKYPQQREDWILTPHPGEAARLLGCSSQDIQKARFQAAKAMQKKYGGVIVLKGKGTIIQDNTAAYKLCDLGNPGMATAGMGDVLTGIIAALVAQQLSLTEAAALGVYLHAKAGDKMATQIARGMLASDLIAMIPQVIHAISHEMFPTPE